MVVGIWLLMTPEIFDHAEQLSAIAFNERVCGMLVIVLAALSLWHKMRLAHLLIGPVALWLAALPYFTIVRPGPPAVQSDMTAAFLLFTLFLVPNPASRPPESWRRFGSADR